MQSKSKRNRRSTRAAGLVLALLTLAAVPTSAQVPQDTTFSGRLVDGAGIPLVGPAMFDVSIFDVPADGSALYSERHIGVPLDAQGNFSVLLGTGNPALGSPPYGASLFSDPERYIEVILLSPISEVLAPRVPVASVPWSLIAQQANKIVPDPNVPRFEDCGDGTVADHQTGLQWEKKTGTLGTGVVCRGPAGCPDPHDVNNLYQWSSNLVDPDPIDPDGNAFTDFLARLNGEFDPRVVTGCFTGHCDWELPKISELQTILIGPDAGPGQATTCSTAPCIDPAFAAVGGPTTSFLYSSASIAPPLIEDLFWLASTFEGIVGLGGKTSDHSVRAVRAGSCD